MNVDVHIRLEEKDAAKKGEVSRWCARVLLKSR
jgi:hypothetical protein